MTVRQDMRGADGTMGESTRAKRRIRLYIILGIVLLLIATALFLIFRPRMQRVTVAAVQKQTIENKVFSAGNIKPVNRQVIGVTGLPAPVEKVYVHSGDSVHTGQLMAVCENEPQTAALSSAKTGLSQAQAALQATEQQESAAPAGFQAQFTGTLASQRTAVAEAKAQLAQAQAAYDSTEIRASINGIVLSVNPDGIASDGTQAPVIEVVGGAKQVIVEVSQVDAVHLSKGLKATVQSDAYPNQTWTGTVNYIAPFADTSTSSTGQVEVHLALPAKCPIPYGYQVNVHIISQTHKNVLVVPYAALAQSGSDYVVFTVSRDGQVHRAPVQLGITTDTDVEVTSGLKSGQVVVMNPPGGLENGSKVVVTGHD